MGVHPSGSQMGKLYRDVATGAVYWAHNNRLLGLASETVLINIFGIDARDPYIENVGVLPYPVGETIEAGSCLVLNETTRAVYLVTTKRVYGIGSVTTADWCHFPSDKWIPLPTNLEVLVSVIEANGGMGDTLIYSADNN